MDRLSATELELEAQSLVKTDVRELVLERDASCCRLCGQYCEHPNLHHIRFRSQGGLDVPSNLITLGGVPGHRCHHDRAHGPRAAYWRALFERLVERPGITALQLARWDSV